MLNAPASNAEASTRPPLAVDLDGTLIRCDLFTEAMIRLGFEKPWLLPALAGWLMRGRAHAKARLAGVFPPHPEALPYDDRLVAWIREERADGRTIALATASDEHAARAIASHLDCFDAVFASDGETNLKSQRKADALATAYPQGFTYAGNESADIKVWRAAASAVVVNASGSLTRRAERNFSVERTFAPEHGALRGLLKAMRPQQWAKNLLVFVPMLAGHGWLNMEAWRHAFLAFFALSFVASGLYLVNDLSDISADRQHPRKKRRPFASGAASPVLGVAALLALLAGGFAIGAASGALVPLIFYGTTSALYTFVLKRVTLLDVFTLAGLYTWRIVLGGVATGFLASDWLLAFSVFFFFSLALVKRAAEVDVMRADLIGRGYRASDGAMLKRMSVGAGMMSALVLALYLQEPARQLYRAPEFLWALPAAVLFWLSRVWIKLDRGEMHDDPLAFALKDRTSWAVGALVVAAFAAAVIAR
ncbi:MAG: UbiA family prenyltransferase [Proteobacteria bacterium]|nr:UbiA family prenyltransferase [Pseudomonadota bacterium]